MPTRGDRGLGAATARRWAVDGAILVAIGLLMGFLGPFASERVPVGPRYVYWLICMVGGGLIAIAADALLTPRVPQLWRRVAVVSVLSTPFVTLLVMTSHQLILGGRVSLWVYAELFPQVALILLAVMVVRALVWRRTVQVETRTVVAAPLPEAEAAFRRRLSARRRTARLIAVEAHDHYLKVHTDAGVELITLRFADALAELALAHGWRVHRSWWIAADAVEAVRWRRGAGEARLLGGLTAPVSRSHAKVLKDAGWT